jgi:hypothetical protein
MIDLHLSLEISVSQCEGLTNALNSDSFLRESRKVSGTLWETRASMFQILKSIILYSEALSYLSCCL